MIKEIETIAEISGDFSPLLSRIFVSYKYKSGSDNAWRQVDSEDNTTALLSSVDGNFTLISTEDTDFEEIKEFLEFFGCNSVLSDVPLSASAKSYALFRFLGNNSSEDNFDYCVLDSASTVSLYKEFYSLLFADLENDFDLWYCDFSKKIVNNDAKAICLKQDEKPVSIAIAPMLYKNTAIISGVYTLKNCRNKGFSKATIYKLIEELKKNNVTDIYLWCEKDVEEFYEKIGFEKNREVYLGVIKWVFLSLVKK